MHYAVQINQASAIVEEKAGLQQLTRVWSLFTVGAVGELLARGIQTGAYQGRDVRSAGQPSSRKVTNSTLEKGGGQAAEEVRRANPVRLYDAIPELTRVVAERSFDVGRGLTDVETSLK